MGVAAWEDASVVGACVVLLDAGAGGTCDNEAAPPGRRGATFGLKDKPPVFFSMELMATDAYGCYIREFVVCIASLRIVQLCAFNNVINSL